LEVAQTLSRLRSLSHSTRPPARPSTTRPLTLPPARPPARPHLPQPPTPDATADLTDDDGVAVADLVGASAPPTVPSRPGRYKVLSLCDNNASVVGCSQASASTTCQREGASLCTSEQLTHVYASGDASFIAWTSNTRTGAMTDARLFSVAQTGAVAVAGDNVSASVTPPSNGVFTLGSVAHAYSGAPSPRFLWFNASDAVVGTAVGAACCYADRFGGGGSDTSTTTSSSTISTTTISTTTAATTATTASSSSSGARTAVAYLGLEPRVAGAVTLSQLSPAHAVTVSVDLQVRVCACLFF
jgi:hypothetical protein